MPVVFRPLIKFSVRDRENIEAFSLAYYFEKGASRNRVVQ